MTPGRQTGPTTTPTSSKSVFRAFLGSEARGIFLSETILTRSPVSHSRRERCSLQPSLPKPKWRRRREPGHLAQPRQQQRRGRKLALGRLPRVLSRSLSVEDQELRKSRTSAICSGGQTTRSLSRRSHGFIAGHHYISDERQQQPRCHCGGQQSVRSLLRRRHLPRPQATSAELRASSCASQDFTAGGALRDGTAKGVLQGPVTDDYENETFVQVDIVVPGIGRSLFSVIKVTKKSIVAIFEYEDSRLDGFNITVSLRSKSGDLYSFVLDLSADGYGAKDLAMNAVANAQVLHWRLDHLHAQSLDILRKRDGTGIPFGGAVLDCDVCAVGKVQPLAHPKTAKPKAKWTFQLWNLMGPFTPVAIGDYRYVSKVTNVYTK